MGGTWVLSRLVKEEREMSIEYVEGVEVRSWMEVDRSCFSIIDVRDEDFTDHIPGAINFPSESWGDETLIDKVIERTKGNKYVVFHCMKSQVRGPSCANLFQGM
jgi:rhodanese-related sulfurtransferase